MSETKAEPVAAPAQDKENVAPVKKEETPKKRGSIFGSLSRSISKATQKTPKDTKKETATTPTTVPEAAEPKETTATPLAEEKKEETPVAAPEEKTIGDVPAEAVTVGEAPKSNPAAVSATA